MSRTAVIAVGGNSLIRAGEKGTIVEQIANTRRTAEAIVQIIRLGFHVVVTHGNGPQVGAALLRSERAADHVYTHPLDVCDATTQGEIGYLLQQSLRGALADAGLYTPVVTVLTQVVVSPTDPAMERPTKPIGPFYSAREAESRRQQFGWQVVEDAARGYRRVVPSPEPIEIVEEDVIRRLTDTGVLVIAVGGGGIPVVKDASGDLRGVEAVIDKDLASALLAQKLDADIFIISTAVRKVCINFEKPGQRELDTITVTQAKQYLAEGQFGKGTMAPKIQAIVRFLEAGGRRAIISCPEDLEDALAGKAGTHIVPG